MATTKIFNYDLEVDEITKVRTDQFDAIANDFMKEFFSELDRSGVLHVKTPSGGRQKIHNMKPELELLKTAMMENRRSTIDQQDPNFP